MEFVVCFFVFLAAAIGLFIYSIIGLVRTPNDNPQKRLKFKIYLGLSISVFVIYALIFIGLGLILADMAVNGM